MTVRVPSAPTAAPTFSFPSSRRGRSTWGFWIQLLPGAGEDVIAKVEGGVMAAGAVTSLLDKNSDPEALLRTVLSDFEVEILETSPTVRVPSAPTAAPTFSFPSSRRGRST